MPPITACSPAGKEYEGFVVSKQLVPWILGIDQAKDLDQLRVDAALKRSVCICVEIIAKKEKGFRG
jgi:hypothetical protein